MIHAHVCAFLVLCLCICSYAQHDRIVPFHAEIKRQVEEDLRCDGMNSTSILLTATTSSTFGYTDLQRHGIKLMEGSEDNICLLKKLITICLDNECEKMCKDKRVSHCTRFVPIGAFDTHKERSDSDPTPSYSGGTHGSEDWRALTHLNWEFIATAFKMGASSVLWMDADMLLLKNPYVDLAKHVDESAVLHLTDTAPSSTGVAAATIAGGCSSSSPVHTGFMLLGLSVKNFKYRVIQLAAHMLEKDHREEIMQGKALEQQVLAAVMKEVDVTHCALPKLRYTGACHHAHDDGARVQDVVVYHASCTNELSHEQKIKLMEHMLAHKAHPEKDSADVNPFDP